ncbi:serine hydrolase [Acinetobacter rudis]|uniref:D-alanyl-D-alanine carboxypeptidase family protein n=1 Tax=Acinetobacter rudis TaxID=632955 RepID=UPI00280D3182|nr:serine hydrolase [Acinetobacter rudis]MDQ8953470.1 serine hydrolase [Acinetobacter rudis]
MSYLTAENVIVVPLDAQNNPDYLNLLINKNSEQVTMPASLTKVLSTVVALESKININEIFNVIDEDVVSGSGYNLQDGDQVSLIDLLHNMMLPSSNTAANCVARVLGERMGGDRQTFVEAMNVKALSIGMKNSKFFNPSGLAHGKQLSTPIDLAKLGVYACQNLVMQDIWSKSEYKMKVLGVNPRVEKIKTSVMAIQDQEFWALGGKTGSLGDLYNIILYFQLKDGRKALAVTARSSSSDGRALDSQIIAKYCNELL